MKKLSAIFAFLAIILSNAMCAVVAYCYCNMKWQIEYMGNSAPAWVAFFYVIPFIVFIAVFSALSIAFRKKAYLKL